jgi:ABC-type uncharacterized transport system substrate-binding protein
MSNLRRRAGLSAALLLWPLTAGAADIAIVKSTDPSYWRPALSALLGGLAGHSVTEYDLKGGEEPARRLVAGLKGHAAVVVAVGPLAARLTRELLPRVPTVLCMVSEPERMGLLSGPTAGVASGMPVKNQLAAFRALHPSLRRLGVIYTASELAGYMARAREAATLLKLSLVERTVESDKEVPAALRSLLEAESLDALWMPMDPAFDAEAVRRLVFREAFRAGKPVFGFSAAHVKEGAFATHGPDLASAGEEAAGLVHRLLSGDARVEGVLLVPQAEVGVNRSLARLLRVAVPPEALKGAKVF